MRRPRTREEQDQEEYGMMCGWVRFRKVSNATLTIGGALGPLEAQADREGRAEFVGGCPRGSFDRYSMCAGIGEWPTMLHA
eukprot:7840425-Pyramimonas_sp.AAC.1